MSLRRALAPAKAQLLASSWIEAVMTGGGENFLSKTLLLRSRQMLEQVRRKRVWMPWREAGELLLEICDQMAVMEQWHPLCRQRDMERLDGMIEDLLRAARHISAPSSR